MSINIQTSTGLLEISSDKVTKEKVVSALGYSPANAEIESTVNNHIGDSNIHITAEERARWNSNSGGGNAANGGFSGDYNDLINKPNIDDNGSGELSIQDDEGNSIFKVNSDGVRTTDISLNKTNITTETWTFTLEDGSTVTKVVCVG